jgi:cytochrome c-type biogenesis protein CcmH
MRKRNQLLSILITSVLILSGVHSVKGVDEEAEISKQLICSCGCGKVVYDCYCDLAKGWRNRIEENLSIGVAKEEIIKSFVDQYGKQVLATPSKSGLELVLWFAPVVIAVVGTIVIYSYAKNKAPIPDILIGFPIRDRVDLQIQAVAINEKSDIRYDELFESMYREFKKKQRYT